MELCMENALHILLTLTWGGGIFFFLSNNVCGDWDQVSELAATANATKTTRSKVLVVS